MHLPTPESVVIVAGGSFPPEQIELAIEDAAALLGTCGERYPPNVQRSIIRQIAAHFLNGWAGGTGGLRSESADGNSVGFAGVVTGQGLKGSTWGQAALVLDTLGCLRDIDKIAARMDLL